MFAGRERLRASHITAIGALSDVTLGYFDRGSRQYQKIPLGEQVEVLSLLGVVTLDGEKPKKPIRVKRATVAPCASLP